MESVCTHDFLLQSGWKQTGTNQYYSSYWHTELFLVNSTQQDAQVTDVFYPDGTICPAFIPTLEMEYPWDDFVGEMIGDASIMHYLLTHHNNPHTKSDDGYESCEGEREGEDWRTCDLLPYCVKK